MKTVLISSLLTAAYSPLSFAAQQTMPGISADFTSLGVGGILAFAIWKIYQQERVAREVDREERIRIQNDMATAIRETAIETRTQTAALQKLCDSIESHDKACAERYGLLGRNESRTQGK